MKKIKICTPVIGKTLTEFLKNLDQVQEISEMVELRVDNVKNLSPKDLELIRQETTKEAILTSRKKEIILRALDLRFDYVDIDISLITKFRILKKTGTKIIVSFHDFKKTPSEQELKKIVKKVNKFETNIIKIATMVRKDSDNLKLVKLMSSLHLKKRIIIGMGEKGKITRILGPFWGNFLTYASTEHGKSAIGQIDIFELKKIYKLIN